MVVNKKNNVIWGPGAAVDSIPKNPTSLFWLMRWYNGCCSTIASPNTKVPRKWDLHHIPKCFFTTCLSVSIKMDHQECKDIKKHIKNTWNHQPGIHSYTKSWDPLMFMALTIDSLVADPANTWRLRCPRIISSSARKLSSVFMGMGTLNQHA